MNHRSLIVLAVLVMFFAAPALAGHAYQATRSWTIPGPGGDYGVVEFEGIPTLQGGQRLWETQFRSGPLRFATPCRAPLAVAILAVLALIAAWIGVVVFLGFRKHESRHTEAA